MGKLIVVVMFVLLSLSCSISQLGQARPVANPTPDVSAECREATKAYREKIKASYLKYSDALDLVTHSQRIVMTAPIQSMQEARREIELTEAPACIQDPVRTLLSGMTDLNNGFLSFMGTGSHAVLDRHLNAGLVAFETGSRQIGAIADNKPIPTLQEIMAQFTPIPTTR